MLEKKSLAQWLTYLESVHPSEIELGLERLKSVAQTLNLLKPAAHSILVAGTNGKGSTVTLCAEILMQADLNVGSYMSPHLEQYNERIKINEKNVSDADLIESFEIIDKARGSISLTYFEVGTLSALYLFKKYKVDVAVIEVGLGGRLDASNIIEPDISAVTSIGLDHQDWLGDDLSVIAFEKAGVFRHQKPAVCGQRNIQATLIAHANNINAPLFIKGEAFDFTVNKTSWNWQGQDINGQVIEMSELPLSSLPMENAATALQVLMLLKPDLTQIQIEQGIKNAILAGRMQCISVPFNGVLDVGHNPQAAQMLAENLALRPIKGKRYALLAMLDDKDPGGVVKNLTSVIDDWHLAGIEGYRGQPVATLSKKVGIERAQCHENVPQALDVLLNIINKDDELIILGSFVTISLALNWIKEQSNG